MLRACKTQMALDLLEVSRDREQSETRLLVKMARWGVTGIPTGFDHRSCHSGIFHSFEREFCQSGADAVALIVRINCHPIDFAHSRLGVQFHSYESRGRAGFGRNPDHSFVTGAHILDSLLLVHSPIGMLFPLNLAIHNFLNRFKDRSPGSK